MLWFIPKPLHLVQVPGTAGEGCRGCPLERSTISANPPTSRTQLNTSATGGVPLRTCVQERVDNAASSRERGVREMCEKQSCKYQGERRRRERGCSKHWSRDFSAACREDHDEADILTGEHTTLEQMYMP